MKTTRTICLQPTFEEVFGDIDRNTVLKKLDAVGICDKLIVFLAKLQIPLFFDGQKGYDIQKDIFLHLWYDIQFTDEGKKIGLWVQKYGNRNYLSITVYSIFKIYRLLFEHYNGVSEDLELSCDDKILLLQLLCYSNSFEEPNITEDITTYDKDIYGKLFWGILLSSSDINEHISVEFECFRLKYFTEHIIKKYPSQKSVIDHFFHDRGYDNLANYVTSFMKTHMQIMSFYHEHNKICPGIKRDPKSEKLYNDICATQDNIKTLLDLKSHPVYVRNDIYYVLNWNHFLSQIYIGAFMKLKVLIDCTSNARSESGYAMEIMFRDTLRKSFGNICQFLVFDDQKDQGMPDAIMQIDNNLFIFEHKDVLVPDNVIESNDFFKIQEYFDRSFVFDQQKNRKEGVGQLSQFILNYVNGYYSAKGVSYNDKLNIYPILVTTDYHCRLNGLNQYLCYRFDDILKQDGLAYRRIKPLTVMGHSFIFNMQIKFASKQLRLKNIIDKYHRERVLNLKKIGRKPIQQFTQFFPSIDRFIAENSGFYLDTKDSLVVMKELF